ncbi:class I adenylate-forming enzyme family protein [Jiangella alkaliphila]|uniref:Long-chain acyl-CoA synthetase n=1 Tax=Jiangella alkaliphila TaxID=419479 RepID=A0A1H2IRL5_9ACTN|nr:class I adenylate-forming enzyme family protein [Jiangella alkaliphila]SDU46789.1 long-chain acyl-CoA synthetase [Jiangella alkaliphila]
MVDTVVAQVGAVARAHPNDPALIFDGELWTYAQLWSRTEQIARGLLGLGLRPGQPVGIIGRNESAYVAAYLGIMRAGCVAVPVNTMLDLAAIRDQLELVGVRTIFAGRLPDGLRDGLEQDYRLLELAAPPRGPSRPALPRIAPDSVCKIMLTSGSTGRPKGVEHTHGSIFHTALQMAAALPFDRTDRGLVFLPLYTCIPEHVLPALSTGGCLEILPGFDVDRVADACTRATTFDAVPTILSRLVEHAPLHKLAGLRWILFASEPMPVRLLETWWDVLPRVETHQFYGLTELVSVSVASHAMLRAEPATVGRAFPTTDLRLDPLEGHGDGGEILAAGPSRMRGYFGDVTATNGALTATGALRTGDIGRVDDRGLVFLTGRLKDIIISGGFNVAPAEIEAVAFRHGGVQEAIVVGIPSARWGETPVVVAVPKPGSDVTAEGLLTFCRDALPSFKRPSAAALVPSLPTTGIGKGDKAAVKRLIAEGRIDLVSA